MNKVFLKLSIVLGFLTLSNIVKGDDFLPIKNIKPKKLISYDLPETEESKILLGNKSLPYSSVLVYNAFTADDNWSRDLNYYIKYYKIKHAISFCNLTVKEVTTYMKWKVEGSQPWQSNLFKLQVEPKKCYVYYMDGDYSNEGIYLFTGTVIPKGIGQNILNADTSKFRIM